MTFRTFAPVVCSLLIASLSARAELLRVDLSIFGMD